jgi:hypothetical protein
MSPCGLVHFTDFSRTILIIGSTERVSNLTIQPDEDTNASTKTYVTLQKNVILLYAINYFCGKCNELYCLYTYTELPVLILLHEAESFLSS